MRRRDDDLIKGGEERIDESHSPLEMRVKGECVLLERGQKHLNFLPPLHVLLSHGIN